MAMYVAQICVSVDGGIIVEYKCGTCKRWQCECEDVYVIWAVVYWGDGGNDVEFVTHSEQTAKDFVESHWGYSYNETELR